MQNVLRRGMSTLRLESLQSYAFLARNWHLTRRYWGWEVVWFFYSLTSGLSVVFIAQGAEALTGTTPSFDVKYLTMYLIIGTLIWRYLSNIFMLTSEVIAWERWEGTIEYTLMAPVERWVHLVGQTAYSLIYSLITTVLIGIAMALFFELDLSNANLARRGSGRAGRKFVLDRNRHRGQHLAAAVSGAGRADDGSGAGVISVDFRRVLSHQRLAGLDGVAGAVFARDLRFGWHARRRTG